MFGVLSLCSGLVLGENALVSRCLRSRKFILITKATQTVAIIASSVAAVASFYIMAKDPENPHKELQLAVGSAGVAITVLSCCGCLYVFDLSRIIKENAQRKAVHEAGEDIALEAENVKKDVTRFEGAHSEIIKQIESFEGSVLVSTKKLGELDSELKSAHYQENRFDSMQKKLVQESLQLKMQVNDLSTLLERTETLLHVTLKEKREALALLQSLESTTEEFEDKTFSQIGKMAKSIVDADLIQRIRAQVEVFSEEDPAGYLQVLKRLPDLQAV